VLSAECPSCGAVVQFKHAAAVATVCGACRTTVLRGAMDELVAWGKVTAFSRDLSPLQLGVTGRVGARAFELIGVVRRGREGVRWSEWFLRFSDGGSGWLAEGNSLLQLFDAPADEGGVPGAGGLRPGQRLKMGGRDWEVIEAAEAEVLAADGELPAPVRTFERRAYADLRSVDGAHTGTLDDSGDAPVLWVGRVVQASALQLAGLRPITGWSDPQMIAVQGPDLPSARELPCPQCGASLKLRAPGSTVRLSCEYCGSAVDVDEVGDRSVGRLLAAHEGQVWKPRLELGARGKLDGIEWQIIGAMKRGVRVDGALYPWVEYFLYNPYRGARFLVEDQRGHWMLVARTPDLPQSAHAGAQSPQRYRGQQFKHFQGGEAEVLNVLGEFDWQVSVGERAVTQDYIAPPLMLSREGSLHETVWSMGRYVDAAEVGRAFGAQARTPWGIAAAQPNPYDGKALWGAALGSAVALFAGAVVAAVLAVAVSGNRALLDTQVTTSGRTSDVFVTADFRLGDDLRRDLEVELDTGLARSQAQVHLALMNLDSGRAYFPVDTRSSNRGTGRVGMPDPGRYVLRIEVARPGDTPARDTVRVRVVKDPPHLGPLLPAFFYPFAIPVLLFLLRHSVESRRWQESDHAG